MNAANYNVHLQLLEDLSQRDFTDSLLILVLRIAVKGGGSFHLMTLLDFSLDSWPLFLRSADERVQRDWAVMGNSVRDDRSGTDSDAPRWGLNKEMRLLEAIHKDKL